MHVIMAPLFWRTALGTAAGVTQPQPGTLTGTVDLTKAATATGSAKKVVDGLAKKAAATATALPFTVTVDGAGRISGFQATFPKADEDGKDLTFDMKVQEYGVAVTAAAPPKNKTLDAPAEFYDL
jgi:hypothetical protein